MLKESPKIWNVHSVLNVLHCLVDKSNINRQLEVSYFLSTFKNTLFKGFFFLYLFLISLFIFFQLCSFLGSTSKFCVT